MIADFAHDAIDAAPTAGRPFPRYAFADPSTGYFHYSGLHLASRKTVEANTGTNGSDLQVVNDDTYNFQAEFFEMGTNGARQIKTFVYHVATGKWDTDGPAGVTLPTGHIFFNGGTTYAADRNVIRAVVDPFHIKVGLKIGSEFSGSLSLMLGGGAKEYAGLVMNDTNIPDVKLDAGTCGGALVPMRGGGFAGLSDLYNVVFDTWGDLGLIVTSGYGPAAPFLTKINTEMFKPNGGPESFPNPYNGCLPTAEVSFAAPLAFYAANGHSNSVDRLASTSLGIVGTRFWGNDIVKLPALGGDEVESVINNIWYPMGSAGFPAKIAAGYGVTIGISIQSPVNSLMTDAQGRRIGTDLQTGAPINDFGADGVDSGPGTEPRYVFVRDPAPGPYSVQTVGTGDGPYTVDVYSADTATGLSGRVTHTGTAAPGSIAIHDFALGADVRLAFTSPETNRAPTANAGSDQTVEATSPAGAIVHLDGSASSDPDGNALSYFWTGPFGLLNGAVVNPVLPVGTHALTLTVKDGHGGDAKVIVVVTVNGSANGAPSANAGLDQIVEATSPAGATVVLDGSASIDPDHDTLTFTWSGAFGVASGVTPSVILPLGTQEITLAVDDGHGHTAIAGLHVTVHDTLPPVVTCGSADGTWHNADVIITCAATDGGSGLAIPSNAVFSLSTSVPAGTETAIAATDTGIVCDAAGNCATAGPIGGNQIDRKAPVIQIALPAGGTYLVGDVVSAAFSW